MYSIVFITEFLPAKVYLPRLTLEARRLSRVTNRSGAEFWPVFCIFLLNEGIETISFSSEIMI